MDRRGVVIGGLLAAVLLGGCGGDRPSGATIPDNAHDCGDGVYVGRNTSCAFGRSIEKSYYQQEKWAMSQFTLSNIVDAGNPDNDLVYTMHCTKGSPHRCRGKFTGEGGSKLSVAYFD